MNVLRSINLFFFFNDTATTEIYTLSLHDALPIYDEPQQGQEFGRGLVRGVLVHGQEIGLVGDDAGIVHVCAQIGVILCGLRRPCGLDLQRRQAERAGDPPHHASIHLAVPPGAALAGANNPLSRSKMSCHSIFCCFCDGSVRADILAITRSRAKSPNRFSMTPASSSSSPLQASALNRHTMSVPPSFGLLIPQRCGGGSPRQRIRKIS